MNTNTIITIDLSKEIIPANIVAALHGKSETTEQMFARQEMEKEERTRLWEEEARADINKQLIEHGYASISPMKSYLYNRDEIVKICEKLKKEYKSKGYFVGGYGEYAKTNSKIYELCVIA